MNPWVNETLVRFPRLALCFEECISVVYLANRFVDTQQQRRTLLLIGCTCTRWPLSVKTDSNQKNTFLYITRPLFDASS
jgi:hypothetical protein